MARGHALYPSAQVALVRMDRAHAQGNGTTATLFGDYGRDISMVGVISLCGGYLSQNAELHLLTTGVPLHRRGRVSGILQVRPMA